MYDLPELRERTDAWWQGLRRHLKAAGFDAPEAVSREGTQYDHWRRETLLLSQTCGYPLTHEFAGRLTLLATPVYTAEGCRGSDYVSHVVVRADAGIRTLADLRGKVAAYNGRDSMSGYLALRAVFAPLATGGTFFGRTVESGAHLASMALVQAGDADVAAIDAVTLALARRYRPAAFEGLKVIAASPAVPGLPYVTGTARSPAEVVRLKRALAEAVADPALASVREALLIGGLDFTTLDDYRRILDLEGRCDAAGYTALA